MPPVTTAVLPASEKSSATAGGACAIVVVLLLECHGFGLFQVSATDASVLTLTVLVLERSGRADRYKFEAYDRRVTTY